jgi:hypothetical protein
VGENFTASPGDTLTRHAPGSDGGGRRSGIDLDEARPTWRAASSRSSGSGGSGAFEPHADAREGLGQVEAVPAAQPPRRLEIDAQEHDPAPRAAGDDQGPGLHLVGRAARAVRGDADVVSRRGAISIERLAASRPRRLEEPRTAASRADLRRTPSATPRRRSRSPGVERVPWPRNRRTMSAVMKSRLCHRTKTVGWPCWLMTLRSSSGIDPGASPPEPQERREGPDGDLGATRGLARGRAFERRVQRSALVAQLTRPVEPH